MAVLARRKCAKLRSVLLTQQMLHPWVQMLHPQNPHPQEMHLHHLHPQMLHPTVQMLRPRPRRCCTYPPQMLHPEP